MTRPKATSSNAEMPRLEVSLRSSEIRMMGPTSPNAPAAATSAPNRPSASPLSRRIGASVPSAVVVSATPTNRVLSTTSTASNSPATTSANATDTPQPVSASRAGIPRSWLRSSSKPARKNRNASPKSAST